MFLHKQLVFGQHSISFSHTHIHTSNSTHTLTYTPGCRPVLVWWWV